MLHVTDSQENDNSWYPKEIFVETVLLAGVSRPLDERQVAVTTN